MWPSGNYHDVLDYPGLGQVSILEQEGVAQLWWAEWERGGFPRESEDVLKKWKREHILQAKWPFFVQLVIEHRG